MHYNFKIKIMADYNQDLEILNDFLELSLKQNLLSELILSTIEEIRKNPTYSLKDALINSCIELGIEPDDEYAIEDMLEIEDDMSEIEEDLLETEEFYSLNEEISEEENINNDY